MSRLYVLRFLVSRSIGRVYGHRTSNLILAVVIAYVRRVIVLRGDYLRRRRRRRR
jgi:hypothetical protein